AANVAARTSIHSAHSGTAYPSPSSSSGRAASSAMAGADHVMHDASAAEAEEDGAGITASIRVGGSRGRGTWHKRVPPSSAPGKTPKQTVAASKVTCYRCGGIGHRMAQCPSDASLSANKAVSQYSMASSSGLFLGTVSFGDTNVKALLDSGSAS